MKIGFKMTLIMVLMTFSSLVITSGVLVFRASNSEKELTMTIAMLGAERVSEAFGEFLGEHWDQAKAMIKMVELFENIPIERRREYLVENLRKVLDDSDAVAFAWITFDENVLEGDDLAQIGRIGTSERGRFAPIFSRSTAGAIGLDVMRNDGGTADFSRMPREMGRQTISEPYQLMLGGEKRTLVTIGSPIRNSKNEIVGVAGINISVNILQTIGQSIDTTIEGTRSMAFSNSGTTISHYDSSHLMVNVQEFGQQIIGTNMDKFLKSIKNGEEIDFENAIENEVFWFFSVPIAIDPSVGTWNYTVLIPKNEALADSRQMILFSILLTAAMVLVAAFIALFLSRTITRPIADMAGMLKDIAQGEGDLTAKLPENAKDETGEASRFFNQTMEKIRDLILLIKNQTGALSGIGNDLVSNMQQTSSAMNQIAANILNIKSRITNQSASVTQTNANMEQVTVNIDKLNDHVARQTDAVSQSSSAIEEMIANINSVTATLTKNAGNIKALMESSEVGRSSLQGVVADIQEIARESEGLLEINSVMENIASQTNLLSMNAAIEAAHAGEAGKGFAVVADEIRKLAESSGEQSKTIGSVLKRIKGSMDKITRSTDSVLANFEKIDHEIKTVAQQSTSIRNAMEEQNEGSRQILSAASQVSEITQKVKVGSNEMLDGSKEVIHESKNLEKATQEIASGINEMAIGTDEVNIAVNNVNDLTDKNRESIEELVKAVSRFKV